MKPETSGLDLLSAAERTLAREVAPALSGEVRFKVLMVASALRMVMRELAAADATTEARQALLGDGDAAGLASEIRQGRHDGQAHLHARLLADALVRSHISRGPRA